LSTLPTYFLSNNCRDCGDIFSVIIIPNNLGITATIEYIDYSQYWFVIKFRYAGIMPSFQYKIQINPKYSSYFTAKDMTQGFANSVDTTKYPSSSSAISIDTSLAIQASAPIRTNGNPIIRSSPSPGSGQQI
jgi:hypothetical protein